MNATSTQVGNFDYFFKLLSSLTNGAGSFDRFPAWLAHAWGVLGTISFLLSLLALFVLAYATVRLKQIKSMEDKEFYSTLSPDAAETVKDHARWNHIQSLIEGASESDWRQAIIEADIMLEEVLSQAGIPGDTVGDKLKLARFSSLQDAWDAHTVRNDIAHKGSSFKLDDKTAFRAIKKYENVFKEFGEI